jgi:hypothetical protein
MAHERRWLTRLSHPTRDVDGAELARARAAEELLREARERREPPSSTPRPARGCTNSSGADVVAEPRRDPPSEHRPRLPGRRPVERPPSERSTHSVASWTVPARTVHGGGTSVEPPPVAPRGNPRVHHEGSAMVEHVPQKDDEPTWVVVAQAEGILAARDHVSITEAAAALPVRARALGVSIDRFARDLVRSRRSGSGA